MRPRRCGSVNRRIHTPDIVHNISSTRDVSQDITVAGKYIFMWKRVLIQSTQNQSVDSISASRSKRSNWYLRTLERRSENETTFVKWKPQGRGKNHSCSALWWWHLLWSKPPTDLAPLAAGNLLNFSVSCGERYVALPTCELTFASSTYSPFKFTGPCVALVRLKVVRI